MHDDRSITEARIDRVLDHRIRRANRGASVNFDVEAWEVPGEPVTVDEALAATYEPFAIGSGWARPWGTTWFRMSATIPAGWAGLPVDADIHLGFSGGPGFSSEGLIWRRDESGTWGPWRGLHPLNHRVAMTEHAAGGETISLLIEAASNPVIDEQFPDPNSDLLTAGRHPIHTLNAAHLVVRRPSVDHLIRDLIVLRTLMRQLPLDQPYRHEILRAMERAIDALDLEAIAETADAARAELVEVMSRPASRTAHRVSAIGHAHMDSAWLWPIRETKRKCSRTFSNVLRLMEDYPEFKFGCSQAAQYEWMLDGYPSVFAQIKERVADGRWIPIGGMWVEADANLAGGEALLRQFTHGQRFFHDHFGVTCSEVWIPDVFGYPASLPGIMAHAGIDRFLTQKLSWNQTNRFPHQTFWWEGIDGSAVFTHFPPVETYNATFEADELAHAVRTFAERGRATRSLMPFGWGDGGGGPSPVMMETFRRSKDLEGLPRLEIESPEAFFDASMAEYPDAPRWVGELYFEMHRGTFTSQAGTKAGNRRSEHLLREAELWCATAAIATGDPDRYPMAKLDRLWKTVLLLQFHDILPGSSIGWVHREAEATYAQVATELTGIIETALGALAVAGESTVANAAPHAVDGVVVLPAGVVTGEDTQALADGRVAARLVIPAMGTAAARPLAVDHAVDHAVDRAVEVTARTLSNEHLDVRFDDDGFIVSFVERTSGRQLVAPGQRANRLELHPDLPNTYDAWDIEHFNRRSITVLEEAALGAPVQIEVLDAGPLVASLRVTRSFRSSSIVQTFELRTGSRRLDVHTDVDWHEHEQLLQVAFPLDLHTTEMTREVQFGHTTTPIHTNTSWDFARFEVCAHRWVDVSEPGFGFALLNDSKYGHHGERSQADGGTPVTTLYQTLLRGARFPDPNQDQGSHRFTYSLLPHVGDFRQSAVIDEAYQLNLPVRAVAAGAGAGAIGPVVTVDDPAIVVEAVKLADDGSGDVIVRCYESWGARRTGRIRVGFDDAAVSSVDAYESEGGGAADVVLEMSEEGAATLSLRPFQIATLRFSR